MFTPPHHFLREFLDQPETVETQAWIMIVADAGGKGRGRAKMLELMNAQVDLVRSETEAITLLRH